MKLIKIKAAFLALIKRYSAVAYSVGSRGSLPGCIGMLCARVERQHAASAETSLLPQASIHRLCCKIFRLRLQDWA